MAEFCYTNYVFFSDDVEAIKSFYAELKGLSSKCSDRLCNIANIILGSSNSITHEISGTIECIYEMEGSSFQVDVDSKYTPDATLWDVMLKSYPSIKYVYKAEEPSYGVFINTDTSGKYFPERYYAMLIKDDEIILEDYFIEESDVVKAINEWMATEGAPNFKNLDEVNAFCDTYLSDENRLEVYKYEMK